MSVVLDLIGSVVIASFVILMGLRLNQSISGNADASKANLNVQESLVDIVRTIEYDFRKIGYNVPDPQNSIVVADSNRIVFRADMNRDGVIDTVEWYVTNSIGGFPNPNIRKLYRRISYPSGSPPVGAALGVTQFGLRYLNQDGGTAMFKSQIWIIEMTLKIESPYKVQDAVIIDQSYQDMGYAAAFWRQTRLASRNIKRHG
jgi:hypothetical protein